MRKFKSGFLILGLLLFSISSAISPVYAFDTGDVTSGAGIGEGGDASDPGS